MWNVEELYPKFKDNINQYDLEDLIYEETKDEYFSYLASVYYKFNYGNLRDAELYERVKMDLFRLNWI